MKLDLPHIQHYPIGGENALKIQFERTKYPLSSEIVSLDLDKLSLAFRCPELYRMKPLLRPMSDLYKERNGKIDIVELAKTATGVQEWIVKEYEPVIGVMKFKSYPIAYNEEYNIRFNFRDGNFWLYDMTSATNETIVNQYKLWEYLFTHHYDIYGLIEQGLAIDVNAVKE